MSKDNVPYLCLQGYCYVSPGRRVEESGGGGGVDSRESLIAGGGGGREESTMFHIRSRAINFSSI